ncbi:MAG: hypothetical protein KF699_13355 [Phycisphaeraceae bacterium]|nr:hypothetical protein [Phycisphaeraceae bacterium]MBX3435452.1 hypothetical protein [Pirellulales bacterium]MCW5777191.1 hypothetical protein [Phycisphaeraceae bacterium]
MLTVKKLFDALQGLDPDAQVVVGIINGPCFNAAYAEQQVRTTANVDEDQRLTLRDAASPALYLCCYEQPRPWEGQQPTINPDGTATLRYDPEDDNPNPGKEA